MSILSIFRRPIDTFFPRLGRRYRDYRDSRPQRTSHGFLLAGNRFSISQCESFEAKIFGDLLAEHDVVLDIGANIGAYSCLAASKDKKVWAFEPSQANLSYLRKNISINGFEDRITVYPIGVAASEGKMALYGTGGANASFVSGWAGNRQSEPVPVQSLDSLLSGNLSGQKLLIKVDVEGFESEVLKGAKETLSRRPSPTWLVEVMLAEEEIPGGTNQRYAATFDLFWGAGYGCRTLSPDGKTVDKATIDRWISAGKTEGGIYDFIFDLKS
jgi:FkbM family methyltransferase